MIIVTDYATLQHYVRMFSKKEAYLILIEGDGGLGKSVAVDEGIKGTNTVVLGSHITPLSNYLNLFKAKNKPVVYRDLDTLLTNSINVSILKQISETQPIKTVSYHSTRKKGKGKIPNSFNTNSTVLIETNSFNSKNPNVQALATRGFHVIFQPTRAEILKKMQEITLRPFKKLTEAQRKEVLEIITERKDNANNLNLRHLINGLNLKSYSLIAPSFNWQEELGKLLSLDKRLTAIKDLQEKFKTVQEQVKEFERLGLGSERQFYRLKKRLD